MREDHFVVLVTGSRTWLGWGVVEKALQDLFRVHGSRLVVCHGGASGPDQMAGVWCEKRGVPLMVFPALWRVLGAAAGPLRNEWMLTLAEPNLVLAFWDGESRGTEDMVHRATRAGVQFQVHRDQNQTEPAVA